MDFLAQKTPRFADITQIEIKNAFFTAFFFSYYGF